jgi:hypothetical protein
METPIPIQRSFPCKQSRLLHYLSEAALVNIGHPGATNLLILTGVRYTARDIAQSAASMHVMMNKRTEHGQDQGGGKWKVGV